MKINLETSERINLLRFPLIVGVVLIHAHDNTIVFSGGENITVQPSLIASSIMVFISEVMARVAVPVLFLISGFLFFSGFQWSSKNYFTKLKSRVRTLLVPFLLWNLIVLAFYALAQSLPATQGFFNDKKTAVNQLKFLELLTVVFGIGRLPICYQFWYIRELMLLAVLAPIFHLIHKTAPRIFLLAVFILWFFTLLPLYPLSSSAILFFYLGSLAAVTNKSIFLFDKYGKNFMMAYFVFAVMDLLTKDYYYNQYIHRIGIVMGVASVLYVSKYLLENTKFKNFFLWVGSSSFFLFAVHEPALTILRKIIYKVFEINSSMLVLILYFFMSLLIITLSVIGYFFLKPKVPRLMSILTGGR